MMYSTARTSAVPRPAADRASRVGAAALAIAGNILVAVILAAAAAAVVAAAVLIFGEGLAAIV